MCLQAGFVNNTDFMSYFKIARPTAVVEVSGQGGFWGAGCSRRKASETQSERLMSFTNYKRVFDKLRGDVPQLCRVDLAAWGDPFHNPQLADIVEYTEKSVPCSIITNLRITERLSEVLKANPSELSIVIHGYADTYERLMPGASWEQLLANLAHLSRVIAEVKPETRVFIKAYQSRLDGAGFRSALHSIGEQYSIDVEFGVPYPASYDDFLGFASGRHLGNEFECVTEALPWDLDSALVLSRRELDMPCLSQRIFPVIHWDMSVGLCHAYCNPRVSSNYLEHDWDELLSLRHASTFCGSCQEHALHRLDLQVLARSYPDEVRKLFV
jgi:hypothetical protein